MSQPVEAQPVNMDELSQECSQIPNQELILRLDKAVNGTVLQTYTDRVIDITANREDLVSWYRTVLISRAMSQPNCPTGNAVIRRKTSKDSATYRYAKDCFYLHLFIGGDTSSPIEDIFNGRATRQTRAHSEQTSPPPSIDNTETRVIMHTMKEEIAALWKAHNASAEKSQKQISDLKCENRKLKYQLEKLQCEHRSKVTQYDAQLKQISYTTKDLETIDPNLITTKLSTISSEMAKLNILVKKGQPAKTNAAPTQLRQCQSPKQPSANMPVRPVNDSGSCTTDSVFTNCVTNNDNHVRNDHNRGSSMLTGSDDLQRPKHCDSAAVRSNDQSHVFHSVTPERSISDKLLQLAYNTNAQAPVRETIPSNSLDPSTSTPSTNSNGASGEEVFIGVTRKRLVRYFVTGIDEQTTRAGIFAHFAQNGAPLHSLEMYRSKAGNLYAKISVPRQYMEVIESVDFPWPEGIFCKYWRPHHRRNTSK